MKKRQKKAKAGPAVGAFYPQVVHATPAIFDVVPLDPSEDPYIPKGEHGEPLVGAVGAMFAVGDGAFGPLVSPHDVKVRIDSVEMYITSIDKGIKGGLFTKGADLDTETLAQWEAFKAEWREWRERYGTVSILPGYYMVTYYKAGEYEDQAHAWEARIRAAAGGTVKRPELPKADDQSVWEQLTGEKGYWTTPMIMAWTLGTTLAVTTAGYLYLKIARF